MSVKVNPPSEITAPAGQEPARKRGRAARFGRRAAIGAAAVACALGVSFGATTAAHAAVVNNGGPHYDFSWGDCSVNLGNVMWTGGAAVGGVDVSCGSRRGYITAYVYLYRWNGSSWVNVRSGGGTVYGHYTLSAWTAPPFCGGGAAYWDDVASVTVDGAHRTFDLDSALGYYPRYAPGYAPVC